MYIYIRTRLAALDASAVAVAVVALRCGVAVCSALQCKLHQNRICASCTRTRLPVIYARAFFVVCPREHFTQIRSRARSLARPCPWMGNVCIAVIAMRRAAGCKIPQKRKPRTGSRGRAFVALAVVVTTFAACHARFWCKICKSTSRTARPQPQHVIVA